MTSQTFTTTASPYRTAGRAAIISGAIGIVAYGSLIGYLINRNQIPSLGNLMIRAHDVGVILQFLLLIPVASGVYKLSQTQSQGVSRVMLDIGIGAISFTVLFLLLGSLKVIADVLYMFPQGVFGVWVMLVCWRMTGIISLSLRWFGIVVGLGLALVGIFPLGYGVFVDPIILQIPAASDEAVQKIPFDTAANQILHQILWVGSFMGVATLPVWTLLLGRRLLRKDASGFSS